MRVYSIPKLVLAGPCSTGIAVGANLVYFFLTRSLGETYLLPLDANASQLAPMPALMPVIGAIFAGLLASLFFGLLICYSRHPVTVFLSVAVTALILSFGGSFGVPGAVLPTKLYMSGMNILTALIVVGGILIFSRERGPRRGS
jgi:hypothetical protein